MRVAWAWAHHLVCTASSWPALQHSAEFFLFHSIVFFLFLSSFNNGSGLSSKIAVHWWARRECAVIIWFIYICAFLLQLFPLSTKIAASWSFFFESVVHSSFVTTDFTSTAQNIYHLHLWFIGWYVCVGFATECDVMWCDVSFFH